MIIYTLLLLLATYFLIGPFFTFVRNIRIARRTELLYVLVPYYIYDNSWPLTLLRQPLVKLLNSILHESDPSPASWQSLILRQWPLKFRCAPFRLLGTDTFLTVAPGGIILNTSDAELITQILSRPADFPKPIEQLSHISIYGSNLFSTEGSTWRHHRKLISPAFNDTTHRLVWKETLSQSQAMAASWVASSKSITHVARDTMQLSLAIIGEYFKEQTLTLFFEHVGSFQQPLISLSSIGRAGFGQQTEWLRLREDVDIADGEGLPAGHSITFSNMLPPMYV
jgi:hypothetical protein